MISGQECRHFRFFFSESLRINISCQIDFCQNYDITRENSSTGKNIYSSNILLDLSDYFAHLILISFFIHLNSQLDYSIFVIDFLPVVSTCWLFLALQFSFKQLYAFWIFHATLKSVIEHKIFLRRYTHTHMHRYACPCCDRCNSRKNDLQPLC